MIAKPKKTWVPIKESVLLLSLFALKTFPLENEFMRMSVYFEELLSFESLSNSRDNWNGFTEASVYGLLKNNPINKYVNYLAVPWFLLVRKGLIDQLPLVKLDSGFTANSPFSFIIAIKICSVPT